MCAAVNIRSFVHVVPMIYAYHTPGVSYHKGWTKIGYTERQGVAKRIRQQTHTADIRWELAWQDNAIYKDGSGEYFTDREFHRFLEAEKKVTREAGTEWFRVGGKEAWELFGQFSRRETIVDDLEGCTYVLRKEQQEAVARTKAYFEKGGTEFLWNAKPRFGKTLTAYDLICEMGFTNVLIVTNRPSIANSWAEDFRKFIGWQGKLCFVSDTDALKGKAGVLTRAEYTSAMKRADEKDVKGMVAFESLQGLKGSVYFGGEHRKLEWMAKTYQDEFGKQKKGIEFDLLIVDEAQEGVDTMRTERAFGNISRKHTLYLSGTPFRALAGGRFSQAQIYNWSYAQEQEAKETWTGENQNPYETLPRLEMYTYQLSNMIYEKAKRGADLSGENGTVDYAFDLNEFFATNESGKFVHEPEVKKFLHALATQEKYPFSTPELRMELPHTLWLLNRVSSAKALAKLLKEDAVFREYAIVLAAGDGRMSGDRQSSGMRSGERQEDGMAEESYDKVKAAIAGHEKTITLSVGQLTVGVTIPEWSGVLMLCNMKSPSSYMQAAFRAQNPCVFTKNGQRYRKETAYVFDFDPARTLIIFDEFANNLRSEMLSGQGTSAQRQENIRRLLNFFPVLGEDDEGKMVELNAAEVLSIPAKLKSQEVVRRGFMSNLLFQNIGRVFGAPEIVREIMEKLTPAQEASKKAKEDGLAHMQDVQVDETGEAKVSEEIVIGRTQGLFGKKYYEEAEREVEPQVLEIVSERQEENLAERIETLKETVKETVKRHVVAPVMEEYGAKRALQNRVERQAEREIEQKFAKIQSDYAQQTNIAKAEYDLRRNYAESEGQLREAEAEYQVQMRQAMDAFVETVQETVKETIAGKPKEIVEKMEQNRMEEEKRTVEDSVRAYLRGFARTIPSFIMAYGDEKLTLQNFEQYTEADVFLEVTGITEAEFCFLRDGGQYRDPKTGEQAYFEGHLFDETVFNDAIQVFWQKKQELADYFQEDRQEDIFDYIPPQKNNQIFTPRWVVQKMADDLERENPGCFDDPQHTFADLYMKSGLYITEIVKRLFQSEKMKAYYPDEGERIRHILRRQVYGMAPTRIIYLIATNYILGFDAQLKAETKHFIQADAAKAAKEGRLAQLTERFADTEA